MASLKITQVGGEAVTYKITPSTEYAFEVKYNIGYHKAFREEEKQTHLYFLAWESIRASGTTVPEFGLAFIQTLVSVDVIEDEEAPKK